MVGWGYVGPSTCLACAFLSISKPQNTNQKKMPCENEEITVIVDLYILSLHMKISFYIVKENLKFYF